MFEKLNKAALNAIEQLKEDGKVLGNLHPDHQPFFRYYGVNLVSVVREAIQYTGWRGNIMRLSNLVCMIAINHRMTDLQEQYKHTQKNGLGCTWRCQTWKNGKYVWRDETKAEGDARLKKELRKIEKEIIELKQAWKNNDFPRPDPQQLYQWRRRLGGPYDCRKHFDVPDRDMLEPFKWAA